MSWVAEKKAIAIANRPMTSGALGVSSPAARAPRVRHAKAASAPKVPASASWATMIQLRRRPGHGSANRSTSGDQRNLSSHGNETIERRPIVDFGIPSATRKNWSVV